MNLGRSRYFVLFDERADETAGEINFFRHADEMNLPEKLNFRGLDW